MPLEFNEKQTYFLEGAKASKRDFDNAQRKWAKCLIDSMKFRVDIEKFMEAELSEMEFGDEVRNLVSTMAVSEYLAGGRRNITKDRLPDKYKYQFLLLLSFVQKWKDIIDEGEKLIEKS